MPTLSTKVEVLVVGAGPVGLLTALELARAGVDVEIIDRAWRPAEQGYTCGLHAATVDLLARVGLERAALESGRRVQTMAFFEGQQRRAELRLVELDVPFPFLLVVSQDRLEELLESELHSRGIRVRWGHRLDDLRQDDNAVIATVEKLALTSVGYPYARSEEMVQSVAEVRAKFVVGADGFDSHVRQILGIPMERRGSPSAFEVFQFEPATDPGEEVRVALGERTTDVFWPQPGALCRWSLEVSPADSEPETPTDDEGSVVAPAAVEMGRNRHELVEDLRARAPWFTAGVRAIDWRTVVSFETSVARSFGRGRCWLAGDAGHQTGPVGMQSMNVGLREAMDLAGRLVRLLGEGAAEELLIEYDADRQVEWAKLLGGEGSLRPAAGTSAWAESRRGRLLPCLPGSGAELAALAGQLGLELT